MEKLSKDISKDPKGLRFLFRKRKDQAYEEPVATTEPKPKSKLRAKIGMVLLTGALITTTGISVFAYRQYNIVQMQVTGLEKNQAKLEQLLLDKDNKIKEKNLALTEATKEHSAILKEVETLEKEKELLTLENTQLEGNVIKATGLLKESESRNKKLLEELNKGATTKIEYAPNNGSSPRPVQVSRGGVRGSSKVDWQNLLKPSSVTVEAIDQKLQGTGMAGLGQAFKTAEELYGVNAVFLTSLAIHESNSGKSRIAQDKNNLFGFMAYDRDPYNSAKEFETKEEGILHVAGYLKENYLTPNGSYFNGYSIDAINVKYATDLNWANGIVQRGSIF